MRIEVAHSSSWPWFQFIVYADTDSDKAIIGQVGRISMAGEGRPWIHGINYGPGRLEPVSFNFGWLEEKHFKNMGSILLPTTKTGKSRKVKTL